MEPNKNFIAEVYLMVSWRGQIRFRIYVSNGKITYKESELSSDKKIEHMLGEEIHRCSTTHELDNFMEDDGQRKKIIMNKFEEVINEIENPLFHLGSCYHKVISADDNLLKIYVFPTSKLKR